MPFTTDRQTLDDLNIFGKSGGASVCQIYNRCHTRGGTAILEEMFRYPLSDAAAINRRSGIIQYFASLHMPFPFSAADLDAAEAYLSNTDERTKLSAQVVSAAKKISNLVAVDAETMTIHKGIIALVVLLHGVRDLLAALDLDAGNPYGAERDVILQLLAEPAWIPVLCQPVTRRMSTADLAAFDLVFRFRQREEVRRILQFIYFFDVYLSVAAVAVERGLVFPKALPASGRLLVVEGVYHLLIENAVANTASFGPENNVLFLTGANMAGKSTFMKSLSIAVYLAHMGFPVAAAKMEFSVLDGMYTTINLPDDLGMGVSHFYAEVLRAKKVALELRSKDLFVVFDELFRGTNVKDACDATIAFSEAFTGMRDSRFVISTHIIEAGDVLAKSCGNIGFFYLPTRMEGSRPVYTYTLERGITADRHGMVIINNEGILDILKNGRPKRSKIRKL